MQRTQISLNEEKVLSIRLLRMNLAVSSPGVQTDVASILRPTTTTAENKVSNTLRVVLALPADMIVGFFSPSNSWLLYFSFLCSMKKMRTVYTLRRRFLFGLRCGSRVHQNDPTNSKLRHEVGGPARRLVRGRHPAAPLLVLLLASHFPRPLFHEQEGGYTHLNKPLEDFPRPHAVCPRWCASRNVTRKSLQWPVKTGN